MRVVCSVPVCAWLLAATFALAANPAIQIRSTEQAIEVESRAAPTWKIKLDLKQGGVATELRLPASGPNLVTESGGFAGLFNMFACDARPGQPGAAPDGGFAKTLLKNKGVVTSAKVLSNTEREAVIEIRGDTTGWRITGPKEEKVLLYRQTYTFQPEKVVVDGEYTWVYGHDTKPVEIAVMTYFAPGVVNMPVRILKADGNRIPLLVTSSGGSLFPDGFKHPLALEVALRDGQRVIFRTIRVPEPWLVCPRYSLERAWQTQWAQVVSLTGQTDKCSSAFPVRTPVAIRYEMEFAGKFPDNAPPAVTIVSPEKRKDRGDEDGIYSGQFFKPGDLVKLAGKATDAEDGEIGPRSLYWQVYRGSYIPVGAGAGRDFSFRIPSNTAK